MPVSKKRKGRGTSFKPHAWKVLPDPVTLPLAIARGQRIAAIPSNHFNAASPLTIAETLLAGWTMVGAHDTLCEVEGSLSTQVWHRAGVWIGFSVKVADRDQVPDRRDRAVVDYLRFMAEAHYMSSRPWDSLSGNERVRRVTQALEPGPGSDRGGCVVGIGPVPFMDVLARRRHKSPPFDGIGHWQDMARIVLAADHSAHPDLEALHTLCGLGTYDSLFDSNLSL